MERGRYDKGESERSGRTEARGVATRRLAGDTMTQRQRWGGVGGEGMTRERVRVRE